MADYYIQFSATICDLNEKEIRWLKEFLRPPEKELEDNDELKGWMKERGYPYEEIDNEPEFWPHFEWRWMRDPITGSDYLWVYSEEGGLIDSVEFVVQQFLKKFRPKDHFSMEWSNSCSKLRTDGFGGGALLVTAKDSEFVSSCGWLHEKTKELKGKSVNA